MPIPTGTKPARWIFAIAGVYGLVVMPLMLILPDRMAGPGGIGRAEFYYGFVGLGIAWQFAFLLIATDPPRYRPIMLAAVVEKFSFVLTAIALLSTQRIDHWIVGPASLDGILGLAFVVAFRLTRHGTQGPDPSPAKTY